MSNSEPKVSNQTKQVQQPTQQQSSADKSSSNVVDNGANYRLPSDVTLQHAAKLSIIEDKPIMLDYWTLSLDKKALIGSKADGKLLVKSAEEYTSYIAKMYRSAEELIVVTENSIYIVSGGIPARKID
jgi:hypothetical protein